MNLKNLSTACLVIVGSLIFSVTVYSENLSPQEGYTTREVLILGSYKDYAQAVKVAQELKQKTGSGYSNRGLIYDTKKGLIWPENSDAFPGEYMARRYNDECGQETTFCITVERSDAYSGFRPDYYIIVGGIYDQNTPEAKQGLSFYKKTVPDAYLKKSDIYMGCRS